MYVFELNTDDLIDFYPSESVFSFCYWWCTWHLDATSASVPGSRQERRIWDAAVYYVQPVRSTFLTVIILILVNPTWFCLNFCPSPARRKTFLHLFRSFADSCLRCFAFGWKNPYRNSYVKFISKIPKNSRILGIIFSWTQGMPE